MRLGPGGRRTVRHSEPKSEENHEVLTAQGNPEKRVILDARSSEERAYAAAAA